MRVLRWLPLCALVGCVEGIEPNSSGEFWLDSSYFILTDNFTDGDCDWWSEDDHDLSARQQPGFCTTVVEVYGKHAELDHRWVLYEDQSGEVFGAYSEADVEIANGGSENGDSSTLNIFGVTSEAPLAVDLVWGDEDDPSTFQVATLKLTPERWTR